MANDDLDVLNAKVKQLDISTEKIPGVLALIHKGFELGAASVKKFGNAVESINADSINDLIQGLGKYYDKMVASQDAATKFNQTVDSADAKAYDQVAASLGKVLALGTNFKQFSQLNTEYSAHVRTLGDDYEYLTRQMQAIGKIADIGDILGPNNPLVKMGITGKAALKEAFDLASQAQQLETSFTEGMMASGQSIFEGNQIDPNLDARVARYGEQLNNAAMYTNNTVAATSALGAQLMHIPNVLNQIIEGGGGAGVAMDGLTTAFTLARGAGVGTEQVVKALGTAYENLGQAQGKVTDNAQKGFEMFGLMSQASQKLGLRFADTQGYLTKVADQFKFIGDNSRGATSILMQFTGALQNTGLTAKASVDIVGEYVEKLKHLETGTKALISARSGGPGGLQGAFQVEQLLRQGKLDEVSRMMQQALRQQFGGRIYTQAEAAQSQQAASQFMRQRTLLQSGAFGSLFQGPEGEEKATRFLEAMKENPTATADALQDAMKNTAERGNKLQESQTTIMQQVSRGIDQMNVTASQQYLLALRQAVTSRTLDPKIAQRLAQFREQSVEGTRAVVSGTPNLEETQRMSLRRGGANAWEGFKSIPAAAGIIGGFIKDNVVSTGATLKKLGEREAQEAREREQVEAARRTRAGISRAHVAGVVDRMRHARPDQQRTATEQRDERRIPQSQRVFEATMARAQHLKDPAAQVMLEQKALTTKQQQEFQELLQRAKQAMSTLKSPAYAKIQAQSQEQDDDDDDEDELKPAAAKEREDPRTAVLRKALGFADLDEPEEPEQTLAPNQQQLATTRAQQEQMLQRSLQISRPTLAGQIPSATAMNMRHEVSLKPLDVKITLVTDENTKIQDVDSNYDNTSVNQARNVGASGGILQLNR